MGRWGFDVAVTRSNKLLASLKKTPPALQAKLTSSSCFLQSAKSKLEPPHYDGVQSLALKGKYLFSGSRDNSIKKWNTETQQLVQVSLALAKILHGWCIGWIIID